MRSQGLRRPLQPLIHRLGIGLAACISFFYSSPAFGRGLYLEEAPWHRTTYVDSVLQIGLGAVATHGDTSAYLLGIELTPLRRGPLRFAFTWDWVSVHTASGREFGFGDPKAYVRCRILGRNDTFATLHVEGAVRIPIADPDFFPYASGGQELEAGGSLVCGRSRRTRLGVGYIWCEPPAGGELGVSDVPHALHVWGSQGYRRNDLLLRLRVEVLGMEEGRWRGLAEGAAAWRASQSLQPSLAFGVEYGPESDRVSDAYVALRFAMPMR